MTPRAARSQTEYFQDRRARIGVVNLAYDATTGLVDSLTYPESTARLSAEAQVRVRQGAAEARQGLQCAGDGVLGGDHDGRLRPDHRRDAGQWAEDHSRRRAAHRAARERLRADRASALDARQDLEYVWDRAGNLTSRHDHNQSLTEAFEYDDLHRLTRVDRQWRREARSQLRRQRQHPEQVKHRHLHLRPAQAARRDLDRQAGRRHAELRLRRQRQHDEPQRHGAPVVRRQPPEAHPQDPGQCQSTRASSSTAPTGSAGITSTTRAARSTPTSTSAGSSRSSPRVRSTTSATPSTPTACRWRSTHGSRPAPIRCAICCAITWARST